MAVTISILISICAGLVILLIVQQLRQDRITKANKENIDRIKELETELEELKEHHRITEQCIQKNENKKPPRSFDPTGVFMR